ncbi:MAG: hypothetical protein JW797_06640 [Bradymonadales bacterium]|nr:hypothetical protein [Bradymonadales bacterium]
MPRILRINTRERTFRVEPMGAYQGLGGRSLTSRIVRTEVPATCHPLSKANRLIAAVGVLTGTPAANAGRTSVGAKSPLTGGIKEANVGGVFGTKLARLDYTAVVLEDKPDPDTDPCTILINREGVFIENAPHLKGLGTYHAAEILHEKYGEKTGIMVIGPAGEQMNLAASVQFTDLDGRPARAAGRGGMGAVMGSKKVKAIVVDSTGADPVTIADPERFKQATKRWTEILKGHPVTGEGLPAYGTAILVNIINEAGALPTQNFRRGRFEHAQEISGEKIAETIARRGGVVKEGCMPGCIIQCSQCYVDESGQYLTSGLEYETVWALGANTLIKDLDHLAALDHRCDDLGLDTIETGNTIAVAMEAGILPWGDGKAALDLLEKVRTGDPLGRIIGNGAIFTGAAYGVDRVAAVKGQSLPAYDPRSVKGVGVTYVTSPMGGDHTAGYAVAQNILKVGGDVDPLTKEGQVELSKNLQIATAAIDSTGLCLFVAFAVLDAADGVQAVADLIAARTGIPFTVDDVVAVGTNTLKDEFSFNRDAGFTSHHDRLPDFFSEPLEPHNTVWDFREEELQAVKAGILE